MILYLADPVVLLCVYPYNGQNENRLVPVRYCLVNGGILVNDGENVIVVSVLIRNRLLYNCPAVVCRD